MERGRNIKDIGRGYLNIFEQFDLNYFEALESNQARYGDIVKFRYQSMDEIGFEAEIKVHAELQDLDKKLFRVLHNVLLPNPYGETVQIDTVVISLYGIFVIETKNFTGMIFGSENSEYWYCHRFVRRVKDQRLIKEKVEKKFYNPIKQNSSHLSALRALLSSYDAPLYSIIAFDENAQLKVSTLTNVVHIGQLRKTINKFKVEEINKSTTEEIYNIILHANLMNRERIKAHINFVNVTKNKKDATIQRSKLRLDFLLTLHLIPGIGAKTIEYIQDNLTVQIDDVTEIINNLTKVKTIYSTTIVPSTDTLRFYYEKAIKQISYHKQQGTTIIPYHDDDFPKRLRSLPDYPAVLYAIGDLACVNAKNIVGIVGSNEPTEFSGESAKRFGEVCAKKNIVVASILDNGCNLSAIRGALDKGGKVVLVVPKTLNLNNDNQNSELYNEVDRKGGCVVSWSSSDTIKSTYLLFKLFSKLCTKMIVVEVHSNPATLNIVKIAFANKLKIAYLALLRIHGNYQLSNKEVEMMNPFDGKRLTDLYSLQEFLSIE